jgi:hypothetical protein
MFATAYLMGGLGNQMFQIANAYSQSIKNNIDCFFRPNSQISHQGNNVSDYLNNIFRNVTFKESLSNYETYREPDWHYNEKNLIWDRSIEFYGYYQSSKNFLGYDDKIKELFSIDDETKKYLISKYPQILLDNTLSIHIRRGDYKKFPMIHPTISKSYIDKSIDSIGDYSHVFIFSDDKQWIKDNLNLINSTIVDEKDYTELWLMSLCKNNILSNSSFSWWGSFLNQNKEKKVISPSIWFGPNGPNNYSDIFESDWKIIDVEFVDGELIIK